MKHTEAPTPEQAVPFYNWPVPPQRVEGEVYALLVEEDAEALEWEQTETGTSGPRRYVVDFPGLQETVELKWKLAPENLDGVNNSPRREVAAYEFQKLFLEPEDYVVPTTFILCAGDTPSEPNWGDSNCALGLIALWLQNIEVPSMFYDSGRFVSEPNYAYYMSNFNLFTYLIDHGDGNRDNFVVSDDDEYRHVFSIDNEIAFGHIPNVFVTNWNEIRVPALRRESIDRLRGIERRDLDFLAVVSELKKDDRGIFVPVTPGKDIDPGQGAIHAGDTLQFGLTESEIDQIWSRIQTVISGVDTGRIKVF